MWGTHLLISTCGVAQTTPIVVSSSTSRPEKGFPRRHCRQGIQRTICQSRRGMAGAPGASVAEEPAYRSFQQLLRTSWAILMFCGMRCSPSSALACARRVSTYSTIYWILSQDRAHPRKKTRPFASGSVKVWVGALMLGLATLSQLATGPADCPALCKLALPVHLADPRLFLPVEKNAPGGLRCAGAFLYDPVGCGPGRQQILCSPSG